MFYTYIIYIILQFTPTYNVSVVLRASASSNGFSNSHSSLYQFLGSSGSLFIFVIVKVLCSPTSAFIIVLQKYNPLHKQSLEPEVSVTITLIFVSGCSRL